MSRPKSLNLPIDHFNYGGLCRRVVEEYDAFYTELIMESRTRVIHAFYDMIIEERKHKV